MNENFILYHGSPEIVERPEFGKGKPYNDYGPGFYCTESLELAREWACGSDIGGYANKYRLQSDGLTVLSLSGGQTHILNWLAVLVNNRTFRLSNDLAFEAREYLIREFLPDISAYDIICGYRADDSYFAFASAFLTGGLSIGQLGRAMLLGKLGDQVVLKSREAFERIEFLGYEYAEQSLYYPKRIMRDQQARDAFRTERTRGRASDDVYMLDILREEWKNDDPRLCRYLSE